MTGFDPKRTFDMKPSTLAVAAMAFAAATHVSAQPAWKISEKRAAELVLEAYPGILKKAQMMDPTIATLGSEVRGFAHSGDKVWNVWVHCNSGGRRATFFVHPQTGAIYPIVKPDGPDSANCQ
jgi:hypothetical protein